MYSFYIISIVYFISFNEISTQDSPRLNKVAINELRKVIDVESSWLSKNDREIQKVGLDASNAEKVVVDLINSQRQLIASVQGNNLAAAEISDGHRAQVQRFGDKGGVAQFEKHKGQIKFKEDDDQHKVLLKANNLYKLDAIALKDPKNAEFIAKNERFNFGLYPSTQNKTDGAGLIVYNDKDENTSKNFSYTIHQDGRKTEATLTASKTVEGEDLGDYLFSRRSEKYRCTAETPGISQCYDAQGRSAGKVVADRNGETIIYNDKDVPIASGKVQKISERSYQAVISKNLFIAKLKDARTSACCRELTGENCTDPIKLSAPSFHHPSRRENNGSLVITWPDCVDMAINVTLPPRVHINRFAMKLDVMIQPIGKLRCMDVATCGRECFYCDWCKSSRKLKLLENTDGNLCRATEERTYQLTVKLCPPPADPNFTLCSAFTKSVWQKDYWQKEGAIDIWMKFYERSETRAELEKDFFNQIDNPLLGKAFKLAMIGEWLSANGIKQGSYTPSNSELMEYWVSKRNPDRLLACEHSVADYEIEGAKIKTNVLFEAATTAKSLPNIFKDKRCEEFEKLQERRFQEEADEHRRKNGNDGIFSGIGNFFSNLNNR